jgi:hypothetical protein
MGLSKDQDTRVHILMDLYWVLRRNTYVVFWRPQLIATMIRPNSTDGYIAERSSINGMPDETSEVGIDAGSGHTNRYRHAERSTTTDMSTEIHVSIRSIPVNPGG